MRLVGTEGLRRLMRLGILVAAVMLTAGCGGGSGDEPGTVGPGPGNVTPGPGTNPGTTPDLPTPSDNETAIIFSARQEEGLDVTRASRPLESINVTSFTVWGYKNMWNNDELQTVFPGYTVNWVDGSAHTTTTNSDGWEYVNQQPLNQEEQTIKYWDWSVKSYRFFGVTGGLTGTEGNYGENDEYDTYDIGIHINLTGNPTEEEINNLPLFSHLWYSTGMPNEYSNRQFGQPVQLEFVRPISKVRIMFISSDPNIPLADLELTEPEFKPYDDHGIAIKGTFTVIYPLNGGEISEKLRVVPDDQDGTILYLSTIVGDDDVWHTVLPARGQGIYVLTVKVSGEPKTCYVPAEFMDWLPGYEYTYIFKVNEEGGVVLGLVQSAYTDWSIGAENDHTVYNW